MMKLGMINSFPTKESLAYVKSLGLSFIEMCNNDDNDSIRCTEMLDAMYADVKEAGLYIGSIGRWNNFVNNMEAWKIVHGELPDLMIKFDASHSYNAGRDYMREISDWGDRFAHVHIKGTVRTGGRPVDDPPAGMDDFNWGSIFAALYARGYDGCLSIEPHSAAWQFNTERGKAGVRFTVDYIRKYIL